MHFGPDERSFMSHLLRAAGFLFSLLVFSVVIYFLIHHYYELPILKEYAKQPDTWSFHEAILLALGVFAVGKGVNYLVKR